MDKPERRQCSALNARCRNRDNCEWRGKINEGPENCPECGESRRCLNPVVPGFNGCHVLGHRGANEKYGYYGQGLTATKGGRSKWLIVNVASKYIEMMENPLVVSVRHNFPLIRERVMQLFSRMEENETPERMKKLRTNWETLKKSVPEYMVMDQAGKRAWRELDEEMEKVYHDYESWSQIIDLLNTEAKLVDTELKVIKQVGAMITAEQQMEIMAKILAAIMESIDDPKVLRKLEYRFAQISGSDVYYESQRSDSPERSGEGRSNMVDGELLDTGG